AQYLPPPQLNKRNRLQPKGNSFPHARLPVMSRSSRFKDLEIRNSNDSLHFVFPAWREIHGEIGDVAGFDADHLDPFVIRKVWQGARFLYPRIPYDGRA